MIANSLIFIRIPFTSIRYGFPKFFKSIGWILGVLDDFDIRFVAGNVGANFNSQIYDEDNNLIGYTYPILPITPESFTNFIGKVKFGRNYVEHVKDTRDILKLVYEQTYCSGNDNLQLSNYFTSTSTSFAIDSRFNSDYLYKDILFFDG